MRLFACFWILLCLVVDAKTVTTTDKESSVGHLSTQQREHQGSDDPCLSSPCKHDGEYSWTGEHNVCTCTHAHVLGIICEKRICTEQQIRDCGTATCVCDTERFEGKCECGEQVFDKNTKSCIDSPCITNPCQHDGKCTWTGEKYECECADGFYGDVCEERSCTKIEKEVCGDVECAFDTSAGKGVCQCDGQVFNQKNKSCIDPCKSDPCQNGGTCHISIWHEEYYECKCTDGYRGGHCDNEICTQEETEECGSAVCLFDERSRKAFCSCSEGELFDAETKSCVDDDYCTYKPCNNGGTCYSRGSQYACVCTEGYGGKHCDYEICSPKEIEDCGTAKCKIREAKAVCVCAKGEVFDAAINSCIDLYEGCSIFRPLCIETTGICNKTDGENIECLCPSTKNYVQSKGCVDLDEGCSILQRKCLETDGVCIKTSGETLECQCPIGIEYVKDKGCTDLNKGCSVLQPKCSETKGVCTKSKEGNVKCLCPQKMIYVKNLGCIEILISTSTTRNLFGTTLNPNVFSTQFPVSRTESTVATGITVRSTTEFDPCASNPCKNGGVCEVENETVTCFCKEPFYGEFCESQLNLCTLNPCKNGGLCKDVNGTVACFCQKPFTGNYCESRIRTDMYIITLIAVSVLFLIIVLILVTCLVCQRYHFMK